MNTAKPHEAHPLSLLQTIPGIGNILSLVVLYAMHQSDRVTSGQACASDGRLVTCRKASGGNRVGTSGTKIGHAPLTWAFSAAATLFLRNTPQGQKLLSRLEQKPDQGKALSLLAHTLGRAVSDRRKRHTACAMDRFLRTCGRSADAPGASRDASGDAPASSPRVVRLDGVFARQGVQKTCLPEPWRWMGHPRWLRPRRRVLARGLRGLPLSRA